MRALDAGDGSTLWHARIGLLGFSQPVFVEDSALVVTGLGAVSAYATSTGDQLWETSRRFRSISEALPPVVAGDMLVAASGTQLWAVGTGNGTQRWELQMRGAIIGVASQGSQVFVAADDGVVRSIEAVDQVSRWEAKIAPALLAGPVLGRGVVLVVEPDGTLHALAAGSGEGLWSTTLGGLTSSPAVAGRLAVAAAGTVLHGLDLETGAVTWELDLEEALVGSPTMSGERAYVSSAAGAVLVIDARRGELIDRLESGEPPVTSPAVADDSTVYVITAEGNLLALR